MEDQYSARLRGAVGILALSYQPDLFDRWSVGPKLVTEITRRAKRWSDQKRQFPKTDNFGRGGQ